MARVRGLEAVLARQMGTQERHSLLPENFIEQPGPGNSAPLVRNVYPPWVYKLPTSQDFNAEAYNGALAAAAGATVTIAAFQVPRTYVAWIQIFSIYVLAPTANQLVTWTLRINGAPVGGWDNIFFPPGVANFGVRDFSDLQVPVPSGGLVEIIATNGNANAWTVGGKVSGWFHSESEERRIYGDL
jgi:hypothetical protein